MYYLQPTNELPKLFLSPLTNEPCYESAVSAFSRHCPDLFAHESAGRAMGAFVNMCNGDHDGDHDDDDGRTGAAEVEEAVAEACFVHPKITLVHG